MQARAFGRLGLQVLAAVAVVCTSCGPTRDPLAGSYLVKGGGAPRETFLALSTEFSARHPGVNFEFEDIGSKPGMSLVVSGAIDLATSSTEPDASLRDKVGVVPIGVGGTAIVTGAMNPVSNLTREQVRAIFAGEITDWSAVGGDPGRIRVVMRNANSAIRLSFESYFFGGKATYAKDMFEVSDMGQTITAVKDRGDVISIITISDKSLSESGIKLLSLDGIAPTKQNLQSGVYPVRRPLFLVFNPQTVRPAIQAFLDFVRSPDGQRIIAEKSAG